MKCIAIALLGVLVALPAAVRANEKFAGEWTLEEIKAERAPKPTEIEMKLALEDKNLVVHKEVTRKDEATEVHDFTYLTDGEKHTLPAGNEGTREVTAKWKGKRLSVEYGLNRRGMDLEANENWRLKKGKLVVTYTIRSPERAFTWKEIYEKR